MKADNRSKLIKVLVVAILCMPALRASAQEPPKPGQPPDDVKALAAKPTPKTADGHPELIGRWVGLYNG
jgi:hypothetical protein